MSRRAKLLSTLLRAMTKHPGEGPGTCSVAELRQSVMWATSRIPIPGFVRLSPVDAGGTPGEWVSVPESRAEHVVLYLHGGYYLAGSPRSHRNLAWRLARAARARILMLDYRLAPEHPYPAAVHDVLAAQRWLMQQGLRVAWGGDSAGGGLLFSSLLAAHEAALSLPVAALALCPWTDLAGAGASWRENAARDATLSTAALHYASAKYRGTLPADHPGASAAYATYQAAPPTLIQVGEHEILRDDARAIAARLRAADADVEVQVWPLVPHVWHMLAPVVPESRDALAQAGAFLARHLGAHDAR